jgi:hypothetical protein
MNGKYTKKELGQAVAVSALLAILGGLTTSASAATPDPGITTKTVVIIPNHASYTYTLPRVPFLPEGAFGGIGNAPFGSNPGVRSTASGLCPLQKTVNTEWPINLPLILEKEFVLPEGATNLRVQLSVDNNAEVTINEKLAEPTRVAHDNCPLVDEFLFKAPDSTLISPGRNRIKVTANDSGVESFLDLRVLVDVP